MLVNGQLTTTVGFKTDILQSHTGCITGAAVTPEESIGTDAFARLE